ncbi:MAG TPA: cellulose synthase subunit BcsC-related outer membrane protein [Alcaligenes sp.]|nr:cellulose synthase subunit BcsC-related outer membrane protein [Alcaligenes sp.]HRL27345.1 cellulose synthase subunit BcsC-related outer membrane protein [Alcaligenes sp.]
MSAGTKKLVACMLALAFPLVSQAQGDALTVLQEQGQYWQSRGDFQRAADVWNKVLKAQPNNVQALYSLGQIELRKKNTAKARTYLEQLRKAAPASNEVTLLEQEVALSAPASSSALEKARRVAAEGDLEGALPLYRQALGGRTPEGEVGLEYYTYLGYTSHDGMLEAIKGLERLRAAQPDNPRIQLPLARHLARNEPTRAQGIEMLERLSARADIGSDAAESWRDSLTWLGTPPKVEFRPLLEAYLAKHPDDETVRAQLNAQTQAISQARRAAASTPAPAAADPYAARVRTAMQHLDKGDLPIAESQLQVILAERPTQPDALGAMGVVRMRQGRMQEAADLLAQAHRARPRDWKQAYDTAQYWVAVEQANQAMRAGNNTQAATLLEKARRLQPNEPSAVLAQARLAVARSDMRRAESLYRTAYQRDPNNAEAITGLVQVYAQSNQVDKARQMVESLTPKQQEAAGGRAKLQGLYAAGLAKAQRARGDLASARATLEQAMAADPSNAWVRLELAQIYNESGYPKEARGLIDGMLLTDPYNVDALYTSAIFASQQQDWEGAQQALSRIPPNLATPEIKALQRDVTVQVRIKYASALGKQGRGLEAAAVLDELAPVVANNPGLSTAVAAAYADAGDSARALGLIRQQLGSSKTPDPDVMLQYAGLLFRTQQDVEAMGVLRSLDGRQLSPEQQKTLRNLHDTQSIRQAESLREQGDLVAAYDVISPVLAQNPNNEQALAALARMYASAGDARQALGIYQHLLQQNSSSPDLFIGAALVANQLRDFKYADQAAESAVALAPDDIQVLTSAAGIYRVQGKTAKAQKLLRHAVALQESDSRSYSATGAFMPPVGAGGNPFVGMPGQRAARTGPQTFAVPAAGAAGAIAGTAGAAAAWPAPAPASARAAAVPVYGAPPAWGAPAGRAAPARASGLPAPALPVAQNPYGRAQAAAAPLPFAANARQPGYGAAPLSPLEAELALIDEDRSPELKAGAVYRSRTGDSGTSRLDDVQTPIEARFAVGDGKAFVRATPVFVDSDSFNQPRFLESTFSGKVAYTLGTDNSRALDQEMGTSQTGVGLAVGYELQGLKLDLGVTPLGFNKTSFTGGIGYEGAVNSDGSVRMGVNVSTRPVTDSVMSFAGTKINGEVQGGVMATGARVDISKDLGDSGFYGSVGAHALNGKNVESNRRIEVNTGMYVHLINEPDHLFTTGLNLNYTSYSKNLRYFTPGHGGYFSPQTSFTVGVPFNWSRTVEDLTFKVSGSLSLQHFKEDPADLVAGRSVQDELGRLKALSGFTDQQIMDELAAKNPGFYAGQSKTGLAYNLNFGAEYNFTPGMILGGHLGIDKSGDYRQWIGGVYLKYYFDQQTRRAADLPLVPYASPYGESYGGKFQ